MPWGRQAGGFPAVPHQGRVARPVDRLDLRHGDPGHVSPVGEEGAYRKCFEMTMRATTISDGLSDTRPIIVQLDPAFEIRGSSVGWTTHEREVRPTIDVNWERPWEGDLRG